MQSTAKRHADPNKRAEYLKKAKSQWNKYREDGIIKYARDMTDRQRRHSRRKWRNSKRKTRAQAKLADACITSPTSPGSPQPGPSEQARQGRKKVIQSRSKCYRELEKIRNELLVAKQKTEKYEKRSQRAEAKLRKQNEQSNTQKQIPLSKTRHFDLVNNLKQSFKTVKSKNDKRLLFKACTGVNKKAKRIKKKYASLSRNLIGFSKNMWYKYPKNKSIKQPTIAAQTLTVHDFYERDDVSRITTGKKDTKTFKGEMKQKRFNRFNKP